MNNELKLPKMLVKEKIDQPIVDILQNSLKPLFAESEDLIPELALNQKLRSHIFYAKSTGHLVVGFENVDSFLTKELHGLQKTGQIGNRVCRMIIVSNDGSDRFYRQLLFTEKNHGGRLLTIRLDVDSKLLAEILGMKGKNVKAALVTHKDSVCNILKQLL